MTGMVGIVIGEFVLPTNHCGIFAASGRFAMNFGWNLHRDPLENK